ncbi:MAG: tetratricopeptide repeat protein [Pseudomonadota bacterium]
MTEQTVFAAKRYDAIAAEAREGLTISGGADDIDRKIDEIRSVRDSAGPVPALALARAAVEADPDALRLRQIWLRLLNSALAPDDALLELEWFLSLRPRAAGTAPVIACESEAHMTAGRFDRAAASLDRATDAHRDKYLVLRARVRLLSLAGGTNESRAALIADVCKQIHRPDLVAGLARALTATGQPGLARTLLEEGYAAQPDPRLTVMLVRRLIETGETDRAKTLLDAASPHTADRPDLVSLQAELFRLRGEFGAGRACLDAGLARHPDHLMLHRESWRLRALAEGAQAVQRDLERALDILARSFEGLITLARFAQSVELTEIADCALERARELRSDKLRLQIVWVELMLARQDPVAALDLLDSAGRSGMNDSVLLRLRARGLIAAGFNHQALTLLRAACTGENADTDLLFRLASLLTSFGRFDEAADVLCRITPASGRQEERLLTTRGTLAHERGDTARARVLLEEAVAVSPRSMHAWGMLARWSLLSGQLDRAWEAHLASIDCAKERPDRVQARDRALNSFIGQLINEHRLFVGDDRLRAWAREVSGPEAPAFFKAETDETPGSTPAAMYLIRALRHAGAVSDAPAPLEGATERIPRQIFQFWDKDLPPALVRLRDENRILNPDHTYHLFNRAEAEAYLRDRGEVRLAEAFRRAPHPAAKSDIFRLAVLHHEGGLYMDPDDRCTAPLSEHIDHRLGFIGYQEFLWSVGNNFLAAAPGHPIIEAALRGAEDAFASGSGETLWLVTGPGLMTRALARAAVDAAGRLSEDVWLMPSHRLRAFVSPHVKVPYKSSTQHWSKAIR